MFYFFVLYKEVIILIIYTNYLIITRTTKFIKLFIRFKLTINRISNYLLFKLDSNGTLLFNEGY